MDRSTVFAIASPHGGTTLLTRWSESGTTDERPHWRGKSDERSPAEARGSSSGPEQPMERM